MSRRFIKNRQTSYLRNVLISIALFLAIFGFFSYGIVSVQKDMEKNEMETLQSAVTRDITRCYAQEGTYPESLAYLKKHYGLTYDSSNILWITSHWAPILCLTLRSSGKEAETNAF